MKLQLYILRELCVDFTFAVGGMFVLSLPAIAVAAVAKLAGVDTRSVLLFLPLLMSGLVPYVLPLGYLLAVVVTYGRLAADREWTAIRMAGINPISMLGPALLLAIVLSAFTVWLVGEKLPEIRKRQNQYAMAALREMITNLSPGRTDLHVGQFYLVAGYRDGQDFVDVFVYIPTRGDEEAKSILADRVHFEVRDTEMLVYMTNPRTVIGSMELSSNAPSHGADGASSGVPSTQPGMAIFRLQLGEMQKDQTENYRSTRYQTSRALAAQLASGKLPPDGAIEARFEINQRLAISTTYLMFLVLGVPTGLLLRRGTQLGALSVAVGFALLYYVLSMRLGKQLSTSNVIPPMVGAWMINALGVVAGAAMLRKALRQ